MNESPPSTQRHQSEPGRAVIGLLAIIFIGALSVPAMAAIEVGKGNAPAHDSNWPAGSLDVANLKTRLGWWEGPPYGGGERHFLYRGDAADFQQALDAFAKIASPKRQLFINDGGPQESWPFKDDKDPKADGLYDWSFTVWNPQNWNQLYNNPESQSGADDPSGRFREPVDPPRLDVFVGGDKGIDYSKVKVPQGVDVIDERADANGFANGSAIVGDAYNMVTSKPVAKLKISLATQKAEDEWVEVASVQADANGHFELKAALNGSFGVLAVADGYAPRMLGRVHLRGNTFKHFTVQLAPATTLKGTAVDTDGKPVAGASVSAEGVSATNGRGYILPVRAETTTDANGQFVLAGLPRGYTHLFADAPNFAGLDILKLHPVPEENLTIRLTATGAIKGRVLDKTGKPASNGNVSIDPPGELRDRLGKWGGSANTASDGSFHFENVPPGEYVVTAMATNPGPALTGKDSGAKTITVKAGETTEVEVAGR